MLGFVGVTSMDTNIADVTVSELLPDTLPNAAVTVVEPVARDKASPLEPNALLMMATVVSEELQATSAVRSRVALSEYVPVAVNCCLVPRAILGFVGVTSIETRVADVTARLVLPDLLPNAAAMVVEPTAMDAACPLEPVALLIIATA